jgi:type I restriction enzyme, S subunit
MRSPIYNSGRNRPYLRVANVLDGEIDTSDVLEMPFDDDQFEKFRLQQGDILLNEGQSLELVGRPAMYRGDPPDCAFQKTLLRFRPSSRLDADYALSVFQSWLYNGRFAERAVQTTSIAHLTLVRFAAMKMPVPGVPEQEEIARAVNSVRERITAERTKLAATNALKNVLASSLLSGELRVTPHEAAI